MHEPKSTYKTIAWAGFLVGSLDIIAAFIQYVINYKKSPVRVLWFIASGVWGEKAFSGDEIMAVWGLLFHFIIAYAFTIFFFFLYLRVDFLVKSRILTGLLYGIFIWLIMNLIVVPLSSAPKFTFTTAQAAISIIILTVAIGIPLAFIAHNHYDKIDLS